MPRTEVQYCSLSIVISLLEEHWAATGKAT